MNFLITSEELLKEISRIEESSPSRLIAFNRIIKYCREVLEIYRKNIRVLKFRSLHEEVHFFKEAKQIPLSQLIYYTNLHALELESTSSVKYRKKYLSRKIKKINKFFQRNRKFQLYIDLEQTSMDKFYFTRKFQNEVVNYDTSLYWDPEFNTSHDILLAYLRVYKRLLPFLQRQMELIKLQRPEMELTFTHDLNWTAAKVDLIEIIYALHFSGAINNGSANIIDIVALFEVIFKQKLGNCYKKLTEIKGRKGRITKFLDEITLAFEQKVDRENEL
ncbi:RteC domain-containing protein [Antarcticibacterium sp. 1MA-6-2]|uniref:RteC domain-containing protein n=1 Tax=Antarcticibacterium sp. 1MA-6-2 TaxID=2908210 RepID=UPI001F22D7CE|nr:RteC domain-containing protein [Antarcticibacterium sp. 1MA-6-2]UJH92728.1 RteC domain-containing protein [Antarcticibacterium sp. 1MA-6-2]